MRLDSAGFSSSLANGLVYTSTDGRFTADRDRVLVNASFTLDITSAAATFDVNIKRGFCRSLYYVEKELDLSKEKLFKVEEILSKCENKFDGKYGQNYL